MGISVRILGDVAVFGIVGLVPHVIKAFPDEAAALASFANPAPPES